MQRPYVLPVDFNKRVGDIVIRISRQVIDRLRSIGQHRRHRTYVDLTHHHIGNQPSAELSQERDFLLHA